jgi:hypothetical protein
MEQEVTNFARFYAAFNRMACVGDREDAKQQIVAQYTQNRTCSLREMTRSEYDACCRQLESVSGLRDAVRKQRSVCLRLMQQLGIDTSDWMRVNDFCRNPRIAGKDFGHISERDLHGLERKLRAIMRGGGLHSKKSEPATTLCVMPVQPMAEA